MNVKKKKLPSIRMDCYFTVYCIYMARYSPSFQAAAVQSWFINTISGESPLAVKTTIKDLFPVKPPFDGKA